MQNRVVIVNSLWLWPPRRETGSLFCLFVFWGKAPYTHIKGGVAKEKVTKKNQKKEGTRAIHQQLAGARPQTGKKYTQESHIIAPETQKKRFFHRFFLQMDITWPQRLPRGFQRFFCFLPACSGRPKRKMGHCPVKSAFYKRRYLVNYKILRPANRMEKAEEKEIRSWHPASTHYNGGVRDFSFRRRIPLLLAGRGVKRPSTF